MMSIANRRRWERLGVLASRVLPRVQGRWWGRAADLVFPPCCAFCRTDVDQDTLRPQLCDECRDRLLSQRGPRCGHCGGALPGPSQRASDCPQCRDRVFHFDRVVPLGTYERELRDAIVRMKHFHEQPLAAAVGELLAERVASELGENPADVIAPMPIHWLRRLWRGTSSPEVMAEVVAAQSGVPLARSLLHCRRKTKKQSMLSPWERRRNVHGALGVSSGYLIEGLHVVVIDDTVTTAATANEAARVLRRAGARRVTIATLARAHRPLVPARRAPRASNRLA